jgi:hypothetical protein
MIHLDEGHEIWVVAVIVLHQYAIILQAYDRDTVTKILRKGCDPETERGARAQLLPWRWRLAPINRVDGPFMIDDDL